jgi:carbamoyltransferase
LSVLLGFYLGLHDSNIAVAIDGVVRYAKSERRTGIKHHRATLSFVREMCKEWQITSIDAICFSDGNRNGLGICPAGDLAFEVAPIAGLANVPTFCIDHHYGHVLSAWPLVDLSNVQVGVAIDGRGDHNARRRVICQPGSSAASIEYSDTGFTMGTLFNEIGFLMGLCPDKVRETAGSVDVAGKVMGAQAYGRIDRGFVGSVDINTVRSDATSLLTAIPWKGIIPASDKSFFNFANPHFRDWLASIHSIVELETLDFFRRHAQADSRIVYSGGCAQNVVCNDRLYREFPNLVIPPHCYDGGLALGALEYLRIIRGDPAFCTSGFPYWQDDVEPSKPSENEINKVVELLAKGRIVGWFQGRGEVGPRALGNRSILMAPGLSTGKEILNSRIKHRESWRPYGASILADHASEWTGSFLESPYMLRAVAVADTMQSFAPSVVHEDGTCRFQTVSSEQNPLFAELLERFKALTGTPLLLNTSLNGGGQPIFSSANQCRSFAKDVDIDAVLVGNQFCQM